MSRTLDARLRKLEQRIPSRARRWHRIIGDNEAELAVKRAALTTSPGWTEGDNIIERLVVDPLVMSAQQNQPQG
jgi:hypothetical protein